MLGIAGISACATQTADALRQQGHEPLSGSELRAIFNGGVTQNWMTSQYSGPPTIGRMAPPSSILGGTSSEGTWRIADGKLCTRYEAIRDGEEACLTVFEVEASTSSSTAMS